MLAKIKELCPIWYWIKKQSTRVDLRLEIVSYLEVDPTRSRSKIVAVDR